jgi:hypothetical protein
VPVAKERFDRKNDRITSFVGYRFNPMNDQPVAFAIGKVISFRFTGDTMSGRTVRLNVRSRSQILFDRWQK